MPTKRGRVLDDSSRPTPSGGCCLDQYHQRLNFIERPRLSDRPAARSHSDFRQQPTWARRTCDGCLLKHQVKSRLVDDQLNDEGRDVSFPPVAEDVTNVDHGTLEDVPASHLISLRSARGHPVRLGRQAPAAHYKCSRPGCCSLAPERGERHEAFRAPFCGRIRRMILARVLPISAVRFPDTYRGLLSIVVVRQTAISSRGETVEGVHSREYAVAGDV